MVTAKVEVDISPDKIFRAYIDMTDLMAKRIIGAGMNNTEYTGSMETFISTCTMETKSELSTDNMTVSAGDISVSKNDISVSPEDIPMSTKIYGWSVGWQEEVWR